MFDLNSLPVSGGILAAGFIWVLVACFALGPLVADRSIERSQWQQTCTAKLRNAIAERVPEVPARPSVTCTDVMGLFGNQADQFCRQGGNAIFDLLKIDPLAEQRKQARRLRAARLARLAKQAPSRCSCAATFVKSDRLMWGLYAGSARLIGGPQNLQTSLAQALHTPVCSQSAEG